MNRVIKFRAYNTFFKEMWDCDTLILNGIYLAPSSVGFINVHNDLSQTPDLIPLQFTGLLDKNGKEIYEGDIVKWTVNDYMKNSYADGTYRKKELISQIDYTDHGFWVAAESFGYEGEDLWDWEEIEVIGNVFEHKHLLK